MKLDTLRFGLTLGIVWAGCVLSLGFLDSMMGWGGGMVKGIGSLYIGYKPTILGSLIGMVWAFFDAGVGGVIVAALYNWMLDLGKK